MSNTDRLPNDGQGAAVQLMGKRAISEAVAEAAARFASCGSDRPLRVIGLATRGIPLAERLAARLNEMGVSARPGSLDPSFYRDDIHVRSEIKMPADGLPALQDLDGAGVILVDDVMHTGRSARAALTALSDLGRPAFVKFWVLVSRPGREMPIVPDLSGLTLQGRISGEVRVSLEETDGEDVVRLFEEETK
ncbi:MAG: bifunctional pyr operon transcriptional regulator/uracil phosphoribosyltransferase PyrR [Fibrobacterales bacterium]|nr:bifunctional pyr operon transcriptional regulator/uracil phosphoribosyltransferase PyrR [Fibrobacterales bacterium]